MWKQIISSLDDIGMNYKFLINGFMGALIWSLYKKLKFVEALRQILIGSVVAGYATPLIAHKESIPVEFMAALSFVVGMMGMIIIETIYKWIVSRAAAYKKGKKALDKEEEN